MTTKHKLPKLIQWYRSHHVTQSIQQAAQRQLYLNIEEDKILVEFLLLMCSFAQPVRIEYITTLAFSIARRRPLVSKAPGENRAQAFGKSHAEPKAKPVRSISWRHYKMHRLYILVTRLRSSFK